MGVLPVKSLRDCSTSFRPLRGDWSDRPFIADFHEVVGQAGS